MQDHEQPQLRLTIALIRLQGQSLPVGLLRPVDVGGLQGICQATEGLTGYLHGQRRLELCYGAGYVVLKVLEVVPLAVEDIRV